MQSLTQPLAHNEIMVWTFLNIFVSYFIQTQKLHKQHVFPFSIQMIYMMLKAYTSSLTDLLSNTTNQVKYRTSKTSLLLQATKVMTKKRSLFMAVLLLRQLKKKKNGFQTEINTSCKQTQQRFSTRACEEAACLPLSTVHQVCVGVQTPIFAFFLLVVFGFFKESISGLGG